MTRRRYVQINGELVEASKAPAAPPIHPDSGALWGDASYRDLRATDGTPIDSRTKHREYMKRHGLTTVDDYRGEFTRSADERARFFQGVDPQRREDIARALGKRSRGW